MNFGGVWLIGYVNPTRFAAELRRKPAPWWGFYAQGLRGLLVGALLYLPLALAGRQPPTPSYLTFLTTERYYAALVWLTPLVFLCQWLLGGGVMHLVLRAGGRPSAYDQLLNLTGMAGLVVGGFLLLWDWIWLLSGANQYFLGISHLLLDAWWFVLIITGLRRQYGISAGFSFFAAAAAFAAALPFAVIIMRAPQW